MAAGERSGVLTPRSATTIGEPPMSRVAAAAKVRSMLTKKLLLAPLVAAVLAGGAAGPDAHAAKKRIEYEGKTKEGTEISFTLIKDKIYWMTIYAPFSCVSAQGGAKARILRFDPPFWFRLGMTGKATDDTSITRHYTVKTKGRPGKAITGSFSVNWSELDGISSADMKIWECIATANFKVKPKR